MAADTSTAVVIVGSDSEDESTARKRRRLKASSRSEIVDLTLATTTEGRRRSSDIGNASSSSGSAVVEIQADKEGTQKEVVFVLSDESDPDLGQTASTTTIDSAATTVDTDSDAQVALELQLQEWAPSKKAVKKAAKHFNKKKPKGGNPSPVSSSYIANNYSPSSQDVAFLSQSGPSVAWTGTPFTPSNTPSFPPPLPSQPPPFQPPPFQPPSSFQLPQLSYLSSSSSNYLPPASSIPPTPSYYSAASSNLSTTVDNYSTPQLSTACLPSHWAPFSDCQQQSLPYQLIELPMDTAETQQIISDFIKSKFRTIRVSRIQSPCLWRRYETERNNIIAERGKDYNLNERLLYHTSNAPVATICTEGLDMRLSRAGHFGKGIYFSDLPSKCHCYCHQRHQRGVCEMYACKVILGDVKTYPSGHSDPSLVREPPKDPTMRRDGFPAYYDSVLGFIQVGKEFIIYNNYRAVPQYIIEYRKW